MVERLGIVEEFTSMVILIRDQCTYLYTNTCIAFRVLQYHIRNINDMSDESNTNTV